MGIQGIEFNPAASPQHAFKSGQPDVGEAVGVTLQAFSELGARLDVDVAAQSMTDGFNDLAGLGYDGRLHVEPPAAVSFDTILSVSDGMRARTVQELYRYPNLWTPDTERNSYTAKELNNAPADPQARLAVFSADKTTGVDRLLHFLDQPYDDVHRGDAPQTQLESVSRTAAETAKNHPQATVTALGHRAVAMLALMDRIRGVKKVDPKSAAFILNQGFMRLPVGRRGVAGVSIVGDVYSSDGRFKLGGVVRLRGSGRWGRSLGGARSLVFGLLSYW